MKVTSLYKTNNHARKQATVVSMS